MRAIIFGLLLAVLASCSPSDAMQSWVGHTESEIVGELGPPTAVYESGGERWLTWERARIGSMGYGPMTFSCKRSFRIVGGRITGWRWEGNSC